MKKLKWLLLCVVCVFVVGCAKSIDPNTGEELSRLDPNYAVLFDKIAVILTEAGAASGPLSVFWPIAGLIGGIAGGLAGMWKKLKPKVLQAQDEAELYRKTTESIVVAIEDYKEANPVEWVKLEAKLRKLIGPRAEAVIRELRNLPEKV